MRINHTFRNTLTCLAWIGVVVSVQNAGADALVFTRAMTAPTVMEVFVEDDAVFVELEIGISNLEGFRNLLPDDLLEKLGKKEAPLDERLPRFFKEDLTIRLDDGPPQRGFVKSMEGRRRIKRDDITGEPLPVSENEGEAVVYTVLVYPFEGTPKTLAIKPPQDAEGQFVTATIGFTTYHKKLPVMDFRYLGTEEILDLDWEDPWYSKFRNRNLWRTYNEPMNAFLYVEPYEVRVEVIARPKDLHEWVDLGLEGRTRIPVDGQEELRNNVADFLAGKLNLTVDGTRVTPDLDRIHFLRRTLKASTVIDPPEELELAAATLGVIFVVPTTGLPDEAELTWDLFPEKFPVVRAASTDEAGPLPYKLKPEDNVLTWKNFLKNPTIPTLVDVEPPSGTGRIPIPLVSLACLVGVICLKMKTFQGCRPVLGAVLLIAIVMAWPHARVSVANPLPGAAAPDAEQAKDMLGKLLSNVYVAFDFREEGAIYDTLSRSVSGDLLTDIYLETMKSLELRNQGGARVKVKLVEVTGAEPILLKGEKGFSAVCTWNVTGSVGHWGHIHKRTNRYEARITIKPVEGQWKIVGLELLQEERVS